MNSVRKYFRFYAWLLISSMIFGILPLPRAMANGGPTQPEFSNFVPAGVSEMVDVSTGTFTYNIPIGSIGSYPINLAYQSGITMDQAASCVGLGWTINTGSVKRNMRGLPDDAKGDIVVKEMHLKPNKTWGVSTHYDLEIFGANIPIPPVTTDLSFNNYSGFEIGFGLSMGFSLAKFVKIPLTASLGLSMSTHSGVNLSPGLSFQSNVSATQAFDLKVGTNYNSRAGLQALTIAASYGISGVQACTERKGSGSRFGGWGSSFSGSASYSFAKPSFTPSFDLPMITNSFSFSGVAEIEGFGAANGGSLTGFYTQQKLQSERMETPSYGFLYAQAGANQENCLMDFNRENDGSFNEAYTRHLPIPVFTNDIFSVSAQGVSGSYQLNRSDIGVLFDKRSIGFSGGASGGGEIGFGNALRFGGDIMLNAVSNLSHKWSDPNSNQALKALDFKTEIGGDETYYEPAFFSQAGDNAIVKDEAFFQDIGAFDPYRVALEAGGDALGLNVNTSKNWCADKTLNLASRCQTAP